MIENDFSAYFIIVYDHVTIGASVRRNHDLNDHADDDDDDDDHSSYTYPLSPQLMCYVIIAHRLLVRDTI